MSRTLFSLLVPSLFLFFFAIITTFQAPKRGEDASISRWGRNLITVLCWIQIDFLGGPRCFYCSFPIDQSVSSLTGDVKDRQTGSAVCGPCLWALNHLWQTRRQDRQYRATDPCRQVAVFVMSDLFSDVSNRLLNLNIDFLSINSSADWLTSQPLTCARLCVEYAPFLGFVTNRSIDVGADRWGWLPTALRLLLSPNTQSNCCSASLPGRIREISFISRLGFDWRLLLCFLWKHHVLLLLLQLCARQWGQHLTRLMIRCDICSMVPQRKVWHRENWGTFNQICTYYGSHESATHSFLRCLSEAWRGRGYS